jgi:cellulose synthase (UDP-forming)
MLTLVLQNAGWKTVYLNEAVTEGLAPEGLKEYTSQRARWCIGMMQIARSSVGPFRWNNLRLRDRWSVLDSCLYWLTTFPFRIAALVFPLLYWFFDIMAVNATVPDVLRYFGTYYLWTFLASQILSRGMLIPFVQDVTQAVGAIPITRAAFSGLLRPKGHKFVVTAKGGDRTKIVYQWNFMMPFVVLAALTVIGLCLGIANERFAFNDAGDGKRVILFWTFYNLAVLLLTITACVELPRHEKHVADKPEKSRFVTDQGDAFPVWISTLTTNAAFIRGSQLRIGASGRLDIADVGSVNAYAVTERSGQIQLQLVPDDAQKEAMILKFYTVDNVPGVATGVGTKVFTDIADRMLRALFG